MQSLKDWLARKPKGPAPKRPLPRVTPKRAKQNREYSGRRVIFLEAHPMCMAYIRIVTWLAQHDPNGFKKSPREWPRANQIHHTKKPKCKYLNDESTWLSVAPWSHQWIEDNKRTARQLGLLF